MAFLRLGEDGAQQVADFSSLVLSNFSGTVSSNGGTSAALQELQTQATTVAKALTSISPSAPNADGDSVRELQKAAGVKGGATTLTAIAYAAIQSSKYWQVPWIAAIGYQMLSVAISVCKQQRRNLSLNRIYFA